MFVSTEVEMMDDGTYMVVGGIADGDLNIYVTENGQRTGEILGQSLTEYSFLDDNGNAVDGAIIDPNDNSGQQFLNNEIIENTPGLLEYMNNAGNGKVFDFKHRGSDDGNITHYDAHYYRGMPIKVDSHNTVYASARDIGNYAAGYVAGTHGLNWTITRMGFDGYQSIVSMKLNGKVGWTVEGQPSQQAQKLGHTIGFDVFKNKLLNNWNSNPLKY